LRVHVNDQDPLSEAKPAEAMPRVTVVFPTPPFRELTLTTRMSLELNLSRLEERPGTRGSEV